MILARPSPNPPFSTQWKIVSPFFHTMESARTAHGFPQGKSQRDENHPWPEANMFPHCGKLFRRFSTQWKKSFHTVETFWIMFYKTVSSPLRPPHTPNGIMFYKTVSLSVRPSLSPIWILFYKTVSKLGEKRPEFHPPSKDGFSLIELLVVVAVIAILAAVTAGSWSSARAAAESANCKSNLRQLVAANLAYSVDHLRFVAAAENIKGGSDNTIRWHGVRSGGQAFDGSIGPLAPYLGGGGASAWLRRCPAFRPEAAGFETSCGGYGYNALGVGSELCLPGKDTSVGMKAGSIAHPAQTVMFADAAFLSGSGAKAKLIEYSFVEPPRFSDGTVPWPSIHFRHQGKANVAWADGHVSSEKMARTDGRSSAHSLGWFGPDNNELFDPF